MKALSTPPRARADKPADEALPTAAARAGGQPVPRFRTVLVEGCGWPTEASVPAPRKRAAKR